MSLETSRVLITDDHPFSRDGLRVLLEATPDTELVDEATDGEEVWFWPQNLSQTSS
jgi:DNA-binding NarL/FixJ family response regulator